MASCGRWPPLGVQKLRNMMKIHSKLKLAHFRTRPASTQGSQGVGRGREGATINDKEGGGGAKGEEKRFDFKQSHHCINLPRFIIALNCKQ